MEVWQRGLLLGIANPPIHAIMYPLVQIQHPPFGKVAEWFMAAVLKTAVLVAPWVQIPPFPF